MVTQGKSAKDAADIYHSAKCLDELGCFSVVLEAIPHRVASHITRNLSVPTIGESSIQFSFIVLYIGLLVHQLTNGELGIGAGPGTSGQVQVFHDIAGMFHSFVPKFSRRFALVGRQMEAACESYRDEVCMLHAFCCRRCLCFGT